MTAETAPMYARLGPIHQGVGKKITLKVLDENRAEVFSIKNLTAAELIEFLSE
jgi:hypothetical protein